MKEVQQPLRAEHAHGGLAVVQVQGAQQAVESVKMVSMKVSDEDGVDPAAADRSPHQLDLSALTAIEKEDISVPNQGG